MIVRAAMFGTVAAIVLASPAKAQTRKAELQELVFGTCSKILEGSVSLDNPAQVAELGFISTTPRETLGGKLPRVEKGIGSEKVVLSSGPGSCSVWFGGPDNPALAGGIVERAFAEKLLGSTQPQRLGDGTMVFIFRDKPAKRSVVVFLGDAGGELGFAPATTVVVMTEKDQ